MNAYACVCVYVYGNGQDEEAHFVQGEKEVSVSPQGKFLVLSFKTFTSSISILFKTYLQLDVMTSCFLKGNLRS